MVSNWVNKCLIYCRTRKGNGTSSWFLIPSLLLMSFRTWESHLTSSCHVDTHTQTYKRTHSKNQLKWLLAQKYYVLFIILRTILWMLNAPMQTSISKKKSGENKALLGCWSSQLWAVILKIWVLLKISTNCLILRLLCSQQDIRTKLNH